MTRANFPTSVRVAALKRAMKDGVIYCEQCGGLAKKAEIDHINPDGLTGKPTLENARVLCKACHLEKTRGDVAVIAKAKRREAKHLGATQPARTIASAGFKKVEKQPRNGRAKIDKGSLPPLPRRDIYTGKPVT